MKTTLVIDDNVFRRIKQEAARRTTTISEIVEGALRLYLDRVGKHAKLPPLPTKDMGDFLVDVSDREALSRIFGEDE
jgi:hypothetical protein